MPYKRKYPKRKKKTTRQPRKLTPTLSVYNPWYIMKSRRVDHQLTVMRPYDLAGRVNFTPGFDSAIGIVFSLNGCEDITAYTRMFDQYRIDAVYVRCIPQTTNKNLQGISQDVRIPNYVVVVDRDDVFTAPISYDILKSRKGAREQTCLTQRTFSFTPSRLSAVLDNDGDLQPCIIDSNTNKFIDTSKTDISHYGLKIAIDGGESQASDPTDFFDVDFKIMLKVTFINTKI